MFCRLVLQLCYVDVSSQRLNKAKLVVVITERICTFTHKLTTNCNFQLSTVNEIEHMLVSIRE